MSWHNPNWGGPTKACCMQTAIHVWLSRITSLAKQSKTLSRLVSLLKLLGVLFWCNGLSRAMCALVLIQLILPESSLSTKNSPFLALLCHESIKAWKLFSHRSSKQLLLMFTFLAGDHLVAFAANFLASPLTLTETRWNACQVLPVSRCTPCLPVGDTGKLLPLSWSYIQSLCCPSEQHFTWTTTETWRSVTISSSSSRWLGTASVLELALRLNWSYNEAIIWMRRQFSCNNQGLHRGNSQDKLCCANHIEYLFCFR